MNKQRRKELSTIRDRWEKVKGELESIKEDLERVKDEEDDYYNNMPDNMRDGEKGEASSGFVEAMDTAINAIDSLDGEIDFDNMYNAE